MGIVSRIHGDNRCRQRNAVWEHANNNEECVVDPVELAVGSRVDAGCLEHVDDSLAALEVWHHLVGHVSCFRDAAHGVFLGVGVHADFYCVVGGIPVSAL